MKLNGEIILIQETHAAYKAHLDKIVSFVFIYWGNSSQGRMDLLKLNYANNVLLI